MALAGEALTRPLLCAVVAAGGIAAGLARWGLGIAGGRAPRRVGTWPLQMLPTQCALPAKPLRS